MVVFVFCHRVMHDENIKERHSFYKQKNNTIYPRIPNIISGLFMVLNLIVVSLFNMVPYGVM